MKTFESIEITNSNCDNGTRNRMDSLGANSVRTPSPSESIEMCRKKKCDDFYETERAHVMCERIKTIIIYILIVLVVVLIALLSYVVVLLVEQNSAVLEVHEMKIDQNSPIEQRFWYENAFDELTESMESKPNEGRAKNIILFVGDGMGLSTTTASRIHKFGEEGLLSWEKLPHFGLLKTYCTDKQVPDSAATATALFCGVKVNYETSGVDGSVKLGDCEASLNTSKHVDSIIAWAQEAGMVTGFVTTTRVTHATPSALYAHTADRRWECESKLSENAHKNGCKDIARQLIENVPGKNINVIMGGGRQCLVSNVTGSDGDPLDTWACYSKDGRDLIRDWSNDKKLQNLKYSVVQNNKELDDLDTDNTDYVLGIFANGHMKYDYQRDIGPKGMPSLMNMTERAIKILAKHVMGFVLVIEGGMIDQAHHRGHARIALSEVSAMDDAVERTLQLMKSKKDETLVIVTADHSHALTINGYPKKGNDILGIVSNSKTNESPYTTLLYATGGPTNVQFESIDGTVKRRDPSKDDTTSFDYHQQAAVKTIENFHEGSDVAVHAIGPMAHLFQRTHEQSYVAHLIAYAAHIGPFRKTATQI